MTTPKPIDDLIRELREVVRPGRMIMVAGTSMDQLLTALESERAKSKRYKAALEMAVEALENLPLYSSRKDKGVWVNCRVKGSAMWGLQNAEPKFIESFERMEGLRRGAIETARLALSDDPKEEQGEVE